MKINGVEVVGKRFAYDGCHKIYVCANEEQEAEAKRVGYDLYPISELEDKYNTSCELRFIHQWDFEREYVPQFEEALFEYTDEQDGFTETSIIYPI